MGLELSTPRSRVTCSTIGARQVPLKIAVFINVLKFMGLLGGLLSAGRLSGMEWSQTVSLICLVVRWVGQGSSVGLAHLLQSYHLVRLPGISLHGKKRTSSVAQLLFKPPLVSCLPGSFWVQKW